MKEGRYFTLLTNGKIRCDLCPHYCVLNENELGRCLGRKNIKGKIINLNYGNISSLSFDPIEKKPLYHFYPGKMILSVGGYGCNMDCAYCQNHHISKVAPIINPITIDELLKLAEVKDDNIGIAFTYNEPLINIEFIIDTFKVFKENGLKTVLVSNGLINHEPLIDVIPYLDGVNIDVKTFDEYIYKSELKGNLQVILNNIKTLKSNGVHVEITNLIVPSISDNINQFTDMVKEISQIDKGIPFHISKYFPNYKFILESYSNDFILNFRSIAKKYLDYVYLGNIGVYEDTNCPNCKEILIHRGYTFKIFIKEGRCFKCQKELSSFLY
jgi:pyruvate formate lyase activating enzyme